MSKAINVKITDYQAKKIANSGLTTSEYVRRAIDFYDVDVEKKAIFTFIDECKEFLYKQELLVKNNFTEFKEDKENLYKDKESVKNNFTKHENSKDENFTESKEDKENLYNNTESVKKVTNSTIFKKLESELEMISRILNNPENLDTLPDYTFKMLSKKYDLSKSTLQGFVSENIEVLKNYEKDYQD